MQRERYLTKLREALTSLQLSAAAYDKGIHSEAIRLATTLRVLFHQGNGTPLLEHLGMLGWEMLSTCQGDTSPLAFINQQINLASPTPITTVPRLGDQFVKASISHWWGHQVVCQFAGRTYFRRSLVRTAANQDGGAHVDARLEKFYEDLAAGTQFLSLDGGGLKYPNGQAPYDQTKRQFCQNAHLAMLRQFTHEVLATATYFKWRG